MSRTKLFINNSAVMALQQGVALLAGLIVPRLFLTAYGSEVNGLIVSVAQFISYFALVEAGISGAAVYSLYKPLAEKNIPVINGILSASHKFYRKSGYIFLGLVAALALIYPLFTRNLDMPGVKVSIIVFALGVSGIMDFFVLSRYRVLLTAAQRSYVISSTIILATILRLGIVALLTHLQVDVMWLQVSILLSVFASSFLLWRYTKRHYPYADYDAPPDKMAIKDRWNVLYLQLLGSVQGAAPVIIATIFVGLSQVSVYSIYNMVIAGIGGILGIFISGLAASFGEVIARGDVKTLQKSSQEFEQAYYILITVCYITALLTIVPFVRLYTSGISDVNYVVPLLGLLFVLNGFLYNLKTPQGMLVISAGMFRQTRWQTTAQALIALVGALLFAPLWGLPGILAALILSNVYRDIDLLFFVPKHITQLDYRLSLKRVLVAVGNFFAAVVYLHYVRVEIHTLSHLVIYALVVGICSAILVFLTNYFVDRENMKSILRRIHMSWRLCWGAA